METVPIRIGKWTLNEIKEIGKDFGSPSTDTIMRQVVDGYKHLQAENRELKKGERCCTDLETALSNEVKKELDKNRRFDEGDKDYEYLIWRVLGDKEALIAENKILNDNIHTIKQELNELKSKNQ